MIEIDINSLTKAKQRVHVKQTATRKAHYRTQEVGRKEEEPVKKKSPREGTGKIASLSDDMKDKILELRGDGRSGAEIKKYIESMITFEVPATGELKDELKSMRDHGIMLSREAAKKGNTPERKAYLRRKEKENRVREHELRSSLIGEQKVHIDGKMVDRDLVGEGTITEEGKLKINAQSLVDWAKARGVGATKKRRTAKSIAAEAKAAEEKQFAEANEKLARVKTENQTLKDDLAREKKSHKGSEDIRDKLRNENFILREKLKAC